MPVPSYRQPAPAVKPSPVKPLPTDITIQLFDDGSAICPSRTEANKAYSLSFILQAGQPVVTGCDCPASRDCWHKRALALRLAAPHASLCPTARWVTGQCPCCGGDLVRNSYYRGGRGYAQFEECWGSLDARPACSFRRVL